MRFAEIFGQDRAIGVLRESVRRQRLHHALLFSGPDGIGKRSTASALAAFLLCESSGDADSCGQCASCRQVQAGIHPNVSSVTLEVGDRGKLRTVITIDQIRDIQVTLSRNALVPGKKITIVDEAQSLNEAAQNAFLKTLEEPPGDALIVLVARNVSALKPTVRSRCQRIAFAPLPAPTIAELLRQRHERAAKDADRLAAHAEGSLGLALRIDAADLVEAESQLREMLGNWKEGSHQQVLDAARATVDGGEALGLPLLLGILRRTMRAAAGVAADSEPLTLPGKSPSLRASLSAAESAYRASVDLRRNANASIAIERMWMRVGADLGD